jgi:peptidoglycan/xylan/chitin deacetylase (PgdA/CDA1 family)
VRRAALAAAVAAAIVAGLTGCAQPADPGWEPAQWPMASVAEIPAPAPLDAATVPSLNGQRLRNDLVGVQARYALLPGTAPLNDAVLGTVREGIAARAEAAGSDYAPQVFRRGAGLGDRLCVRGSTLRPASDIIADPALGPAGGVGTAVVCDVVAANGPFFGQRVRSVTSDGTGITADSQAVLYTDTATGEVVRAEQLWADSAPEELWDGIVDTLRRSNGALSLAHAAAPDDAGRAHIAAALADTTITPAGTLVLTIPAGLTAPELTGLGVAATTAPLVVGIPGDAAAPLLTPFGAALVAAAGEPFAAPAVVPAGDEPIDCSLVPCVAMTYDDGPSDLTPGILDAARDHHAAVTFFAMGSKATSYGDTMRRAVAEGHLVENHTWDHPHLPRIPDADAQAQIRNTSSAIERATGIRPGVFRPPYGEYTSAIVQGAGMAAILWDVDTLDWQGPADDVLISRAVEQPSPGSIVLQHDIQPNTARTVGAVYDGLRDRGFVLVTVAQLFDGKLPASGAWRSAR